MVLDFNTLYTFPGRFDKLFEDFLRPGYGGQKRLAYPPLNLSADEENIYVRAEIPGVDIDAIDLTLTDKTLVLKGERPTEQGRYFRQERAAGVFQRVVNLNVPVDRDGVTAKMKNGVLTVILPKSEAIKPKRISIGVE